MDHRENPPALKVPRVVNVGAGFGGLATARGWTPRPFMSLGMLY